MSEHTITIDYYQGGKERHARFRCACGFSIETVDLRKEPRRVALARFQKEHDAATSKLKKSELTELREEIQKEIKKQKQEPVEDAFNKYGDDDFAQPGEEN